MAGTFKIKKNAGGKYYFSLIAGNGEIVATGQPYASKEGAIKGTEAVQRASDGAKVVEED
ncbi:YegP family protein [Gordonia zhaorongruii]|uniref:YegP family protein n=1 Tax=Gordonia zhaorongruii TaxID=2597659 RepID=UPI00104DB456|nr:DUF1508 domain-containing protein [Gordonia zhaorongruii]